MKILFLTPSVRLLGARQSLLALVTHLPSRVEPLVVCPAATGLTEQLQHFAVPVEVIPHGAWRKVTGRLTAHFRQIPALRRLLRHFRPDLIHCNEYHSVPQAVTAVGDRGGRVGVTAHVRLGLPPGHIAKYRLEGCRRIVAVSQACKSLLAGTPLEARTDVVYNGVDVRNLTGRPADRSLRAQFGWADDDLVVGLLGLVSPRKHQLVAAEAVARANARGVPVRLLLAGDAFKSSLDYGHRLRERLAAEDLRGKAQWVPFAADVAPLYSACDANLLISAEEGFGRTIIEAGALGVPSIGTRIGGIPELIREGETGYLVGEGSVEDLSDCLERLWRDRARLTAIGDAARRHVLAHFTIEAHVAAMIDFWQRAREQPNR
ncbi:MAG: glycosyltransferase family 4 protein [Candidatus Sumerlaeia bacterium]|nr:glycosyltransferase family 4 protein [Candidatus Sumerlaeia bacterium]